MSVQEQINDYIAGLAPPKAEDVCALHQLALKVAPRAQLWFLDGRDDKGKIVTNPNIGYGALEMTYANGETKPFYRLGLSANTSGVSVYIMGTDSKTELADVYGKTLGKAKITGYCVKFRHIKDVDLGVLEQMFAHYMRKS